MVHTGIRARSEPIMFSPQWVPAAILLWAAISAACLAVSVGVAYVTTGRRGAAGRSYVVTALVGLTLGLLYVLEQNVNFGVWWLLVFAALVGPVMFRRQAT